MILPHASVWRVDLEVANGYAPRSWADLLHSRLGPALHRRVCALGCGQGPCRLGPGCAFFRGFGEATPGARPVPRSWRLDGSDLDSGGPAALRLVFFDRADEALLLACLPDALAPSRVHELTPLAHGGDYAPPTAPGAALDLRPRAGELTGAVHIELRSPTLLKHANEALTIPTVRDLLHATRHRARDLGLPLAEWPHFEDEVLVSHARAHPDALAHRSRHQVASARVSGVRGVWIAELTPAQAAWIALAEVVGLGGKTALGFGVVRATPAS